MRVNLFLMILVPFLSFSEVLEVTLKWDPAACKQKCPEGVEQRLLKMPGAESVVVNAANGLATILWKPTSTFAFTPINWAMRYIGLREFTVQVKVKGTIQTDGVKYWVISNGDRTKFELINHVSSDPNEYVVQYSLHNRALSQELIKTLTDFKKSQAIVVVSGTLFMPYRSPPNPLLLILDQVKSAEETPPEAAPKK